MSECEQMIDEQLRGRGITDAGVLDAMRRVPRERFLPEEARHRAYGDFATPIACGQTISQPYMVALMSEALELGGDERVLEIGTGSGYQTAVLAELAKEVISIERHAELSQQAAGLLDSLGYQNVTLIVGDGSQGHAAQAPYDRVLVAAAAASVPRALAEQLVEGGLLVIPIGDAEGQILQKIHKRGGRLLVQELTACRFVPLVTGY